MSLTYRYYCGKCKTEHSVSTKHVENAFQAARSKKYHDHKKYKVDYPPRYRG